MSEGGAQSARRARLLFWIAFLVLAPVPLVVVGRGRVPVGVLLELTMVTLTIGAVERADGAVGILTTVLVVQIVFWALVAWVAARLVVGALGWLAPRGPGRAVLVLVVATLAIALVLPIYRSPFHASRARQTLAEVYG